MAESPHSFQCFNEAQASPLYDLMAEVGYSDFDRDTVTTVITPYTYAYAPRPPPLEDPFVDDPGSIPSLTHLPSPSDSDTKTRITNWLDAVVPIIAPPRPPSPDFLPLEPLPDLLPLEPLPGTSPRLAPAMGPSKVTVTVLGPGYIGRMPRPSTVEFQAILLAALLAVVLAPRMTLILVCSFLLSRLGERVLYGGAAAGAGCEADELEGFEAGRRVSGAFDRETW